MSKITKENLIVTNDAIKVVFTTILGKLDESLQKNLLVLYLTTREGTVDVMF